MEAIRRGFYQANRGTNIEVKLGFSLRDEVCKAKYKKKLPDVIEAFQYNGDLKGYDGRYYIPEWAVKAYRDGILCYSFLIPQLLLVKTTEGILDVSVGDYIIRGTKGELYPCKPDIFEFTYEIVE